MYPILFRIGALTIKSYGLMLALAFLGGVALAQWRARVKGIDPQFMVDLSVIILIAGVAGSRLQYVFFHLRDFVDHPFRIFAVWEGGLTFYGGLILAVVVGIVYVKRKRVSLSAIGDVIGPSLALGVFLVRIGCFLNGCCFGEPTQLPLGVSFPPHSFPWETFQGTPVHPTQLYESAAGLVMLLILLGAGRRAFFRGKLLWLFLGIYSAWRFFVDFIRYYEPYKYIFGGPLVVNQVVGLLLLFLSSVMILRGRRD